VPHDADALRAEDGRLREANERLRMLLEAKDAKIADLEERIARLERLFVITVTEMSVITSF
jgi:hypothetical protein